MVKTEGSYMAHISPSLILMTQLCSRLSKKWSVTVETNRDRLNYEDFQFEKEIKIMDEIKSLHKSIAQSRQDVLGVFDPEMIGTVIKKLKKIDLNFMDPNDTEKEKVVKLVKINDNELLPAPQDLRVHL